MALPGRSVHENPDVLECKELPKLNNTANTLIFEEMRNRFAHLAAAPWSKCTAWRRMSSSAFRKRETGSRGPPLLRPLPLEVRKMLQRAERLARLAAAVLRSTRSCAHAPPSPPTPRAMASPRCRRALCALLALAQAGEAAARALAETIDSDNNASATAPTTAAATPTTTTTKVACAGARARVSGRACRTAVSQHAPLPPGVLFTRSIKSGRAPLDRSPEQKSIGLLAGHEGPRPAASRNDSGLRTGGLPIATSITITKQVARLSGCARRTAVPEIWPLFGQNWPGFRQK